MYHSKTTKARKKRKYGIGRHPVETVIAEDKRKKIGTKGGSFKVKLVSAKYANVVIEGKPVKCEITGFIENPANKEYTKRKVITKGALINVKPPGDKKELKVRVVSRPGQDGTVNAVSLE